MKDPLQTPANAEAIDALAAAWLAERDAGMGAAQEAAFTRWQQADPRHAAAVRRLESAWGALQELREFRPEAQRHPDRDLLARPRATAQVIPFRTLGTILAAAAALAFAVVWWSRPASPAAPENPVYATTEGGYQRVALEDGSVIELNAASEVRVKFTPEERHVVLERGEAYFTVAKNKARPFVVEAGKTFVRAVGTAFSVARAATEVSVLVTEGKVQVLDQNTAALAAAAPATLGNPSPLILSAGQKMIIPARPALAVAADLPAPQAQAVAPEAIREALAWQGPRLRFVETPLAQVAAEFNRRNQVQIELGDANLASLPVDGSFRAENVEAFVRLLESNGDIRAERPTPDRIILRRIR